MVETGLGKYLNKFYETAFDNILAHLRDRLHELHLSHYGMTSAPYRGNRLPFVPTGDLYGPAYPRTFILYDFFSSTSGEQIPSCSCNSFQ